MNIVCDYTTCTGCSACNDICPKAAITMEIGKDGFLFPIIDQHKCIDCKMCQKICPVLHEENIRPNILKDVTVWEAWSTDETVRSKSSSGGVFGQIANDLLGKGNWFVAGVDFDGKRAFHKLISNGLDLSRLQNTKYVQSDASSVYKEVVKVLVGGGNVLFSGTPCQVAGCYSYIGKRRLKGKLLTIEVVCHGVPSYLALDKALAHYQADSIRSFRNKQKGWGYHSQQMEYSINSHSEFHSRESDLFYRYFFSKRLLRTSCHMCPFAKFPRTADITIGDSWGTTNPSEEERRKGLSLVIANNVKAKDFLEHEANIHLRKIGWFTEIEINRNLYAPFPPIGKEEVQKYLENIKKELDIPADEYLKNTPLGYIEKSFNINLIQRIKRKILNIVLRVLEGNGEIEKISPTRFALIILLLKFKTNTYTLPSQRYLSNKFIKLTKDVYNSKKA